MNLVEHQTIDRRKLLSATRQYFSAQRSNITVGALFRPAGFFVSDPIRTPDVCMIANELPMGFGILYRHFGLKERFEIGHELREISLKRKLFFLISHDFELEKALSPDGVHWPKALLKHHKMYKNFVGFQTTSAHSFRQISNAEKRNFDACFVSTIFKSESKSAPITPLDVTRLKFLSQQTSLPIYGLGGLNSNNIARIASYAGFAAVSGFKNAGS